MKWHDRFGEQPKESGRYIVLCSSGWGWDDESTEPLLVRLAYFEKHVGWGEDGKGVIRYWSEIK